MASHCGRSSWLRCGARIISWLHFTQSFITFSIKFDNWRCCHEQSQLSKFVVASIMINYCSYCEEEMIEALLSAYITLLEYSRPSPTFHYCCITVWYCDMLYSGATMKFRVWPSGSGKIGEIWLFHTRHSALNLMTRDIFRTITEPSWAGHRKPGTWQHTLVPAPSTALASHRQWGGHDIQRESQLSLK